MALSEAHMAALARPTLLSAYDTSRSGPRPVRDHGCLAFITQVRGRCRVSLGTEPFWLEQGAVLLLDPNRDVKLSEPDGGARTSGITCDWLDRRLQATDPDQPWSAWEPQTGEAPQPSWSEVVGKPIDPLLPPDLCRRVAPAIQTCCRIWWRSPEQRIRAGGRLTAMFALLREEYALPDTQRPIGHTEGLVHRADTWMRRHIHKRPDVAAVAAAMGMDRAHFTRVYRKQRYHGPGTVLRRYLVEHIEAELRSGNHPAAISEQLGWTSTRHLGQFIRRATGMSWRNWSRSVRNG